MRTIRDDVESLRSFSMTPATEHDAWPLSSHLADAGEQAENSWASSSPAPMTARPSDDFDDDEDFDDDDEDWDDDEDDFDDDFDDDDDLDEED